MKDTKEHCLFRMTICWYKVLAYKIREASYLHGIARTELNIVHFCVKT